MSDSVSGLLRWILAHDTPTKVILTCSHSPALDPGRFELGVILQGCVSHAPLGLPAQILACGVSRVEYMPCTHDPVGAQHTHAMWQRLTPGLVGEAASAKKHFRHGDVIDLAAVPLPRRVLFGAGSEGPLDLTSDDQTRTLAALRHLRERGQISEVSNVAGAAAGIHLHVSGCTACNVCVQACPRGALGLTASTGEDGVTLHNLVQTTELCRSCQVCVRFCPVQAITPGQQYDLADVLEGKRELIAQVATRSCTRCGSVYPADQGELCSVCRYRESNPFGSQLPPELAQQLPPDIAERLMQPVSRMQQNSGAQERPPV